MADEPLTEPDPDHIDRDKMARDEQLVVEGFWEKIRKNAGKIPFMEDAVTGYVAARDPATPLGVKAILFGALAYFIMPADAIPDVLAVMGFTDDAAVMAAAFRALMPHLKPEHRAKAKQLFCKESLPKPNASGH